MNTFLFDEFKPLSTSVWKQKIQVDLKGADYNETLLWKTEEDIVVKPFYTKEDRTNSLLKLPKEGFNICQSIFIDDEKIANSLAIDSLNRGANSILFNADKKFDYKKVLDKIDLKLITIYFNFTFLDDVFQIELSRFCNTKFTFSKPILLVI
ncbi:hypothetical protein [Polaribacter ponticola]|uniref:hypothetical protein n=1 Tax=Polaribacter ponticola TaxID=2978475 RepID=UPI0030824E14